MSFLIPKDKEKEFRGCEYKICDFCIYYIDNGNGTKKRGGFAGIGHCAIDYEETEAWMGCDEHFICAPCQNEILNSWGCL